MSSLIAWLDSTPEEQRAARELVAMFSDKDSRDELGVGPIRDAFSDLLFPGTSVLQTRARYYLFVPWCYSTRDALRLTGAAHRERGRNTERALIKTLRASPAGNMTGLIGAVAGVKVQNLPSDVYWNGMLRYGVRAHRGAIGSLVLPPPAGDDATELTDRGLAEWNRTIPSAPEGFPERLDGGFSMTRDEASWLKEQISTTTEGTLLCHLVGRSDPIPDDARAPWAAASESQFKELHHARMFSFAMHGAALLYNLLIAERYEERGFRKEDTDDRVTEYRDRLIAWHSDLMTTGSGLEAWDLAEMWALAKRSNPNIQRQAEDFVNSWVRNLRDSAGTVASDDVLRSLVAERERRKGAQSRLKNEKLLAVWSGASGTGRLTYRWDTVKAIVNDIINGLDDAAS